ncbi:hypothetical protein BGZ83_009771 [Gryganskiella cystojenkinii]|nr:hypothetical protein BGZ83_009771 [Gryganskiella cystojenkinii]
MSTDPSDLALRLSTWLKDYNAFKRSSSSSSSLQPSHHTTHDNHTINTPALKGKVDPSLTWILEYLNGPSTSSQDSSADPVQAVVPLLEKLTTSDAPHPGQGQGQGQGHHSDVATMPSPLSLPPSLPLKRHQAKYQQPWRRTRPDVVPRRLAARRFQQQQQLSHLSNPTREDKGGSGSVGVGVGSNSSSSDINTITAQDDFVVVAKGTNVGPSSSAPLYLPDDILLAIFSHLPTRATAQQYYDRYQPSDLLACSRVNMAWRLAALSTIWQAVLLPDPFDPTCQRLLHLLASSHASAQLTGKNYDITEIIQRVEFDLLESTEQQERFLELQQEQEHHLQQQYQKHQQHQQQFLLQEEERRHQEQKPIKQSLRKTNVGLRRRGHVDDGEDVDDQEEGVEVEVGGGYKETLPSWIATEGLATSLDPLPSWIAEVSSSWIDAQGPATSPNPPPPVPSWIATQGLATPPNPPPPRPFCSSPSWAGAMLENITTLLQFVSPFRTLSIQLPQEIESSAAEKLAKTSSVPILEAIVRGVQESRIRELDMPSPMYCSVSTFPGMLDLISSLTHLRVLVLGYSSRDWPLLKAILSLTCLESLCVFDSNWSDQIWIYLLSTLGTQLRGFTVLQGRRPLQGLVLQQGIAPYCPNLTALSIPFIQLLSGPSPVLTDEDLIPVIKASHELQTINISGQRLLGDATLTAMADLWSLQYLDIRDCHRMTGQSIKRVRWHAIERVRMFGCGEISQEFMDLILQAWRSSHASSSRQASIHQHHHLLPSSAPSSVSATRPVQRFHSVLDFNRDIEDPVEMGWIRQRLDEPPLDLDEDHFFADWYS